MTEESLPLMSIIIMVRDPADSPDAVLVALDAQKAIGNAEIIIVDGRPDGAEPRKPASITKFKYLSIPNLNMPKLKAEGVKSANGEFVVFLEPKGVPVSGWLASLLTAVIKTPNVSVGGSVDFGGVSTSMNKAAFVFEYGAFSPDQLQSGQTHDLPGNNMAIPRKKLVELCDDILENEGLYKPYCQQRLVEGGVSIIMEPTMSIDLHTKHKTWPFLKSRFNYARCFGASRVQFATKKQRLKFRLGAPVIPLLLIFRNFSMARRRYDLGTQDPRVLLALASICFAWGVGELIGYWCGRGSSCDNVY